MFFVSRLYIFWNVFRLCFGEIIILKSFLVCVIVPEKKRIARLNCAFQNVLTFDPNQHKNLPFREQTLGRLEVVLFH